MHLDQLMNKDCGKAVRDTNRHIDGIMQVRTDNMKIRK